MAEKYHKKLSNLPTGEQPRKRFTNAGIGFRFNLSEE